MEGKFFEKIIFKPIETEDGDALIKYTIPVSHDFNFLTIANSSDDDLIFSKQKEGPWKNELIYNNLSAKDRIIMFVQKLGA